MSMAYGTDLSDVYSREILQKLQNLGQRIPSQMMALMAIGIVRVVGIVPSQTIITSP